MLGNEKSDSAGKPTPGAGPHTESLSRHTLKILKVEAAA